MNKKLVIGILLIIVMFTSAECGKKQDTSAGAFLGGTNGVVMSFKETAPTDAFQVDDTVPVKVVLENKGEYNLNPGDAKVRIFGINPTNFNLEEASKYVSLKSSLKGADKEFFPEGGVQELDLGEIKYKLDVLGQENHVLRARLCYPYQTNGIVNICVKSSLLEETEEGICSIDGEKIVSGDISSGPVQVTSITEETRGRNQVKVNIKLENKGGGKIYSINDDCQDLEENSIKKIDSENKVIVKVLEPDKIKCGPEESSEVEVTLRDGQYTLTCWKDVDNAYETKLKLELDYLYVSEISKELTIYSSA